MIGELSKAEINNLLNSQAFCHLACCINNEPYVVPVSYVYDGKFIYCQSKPGKKVDIMNGNPNVCVIVESMTAMNNWKSVICYAKFERMNEKDSATARALLFDRVLTLMTPEAIHSFEHKTDGDIEYENRIKEIMFRLKIEKMTGRFENQ
jgi:nitroimidazol reductase NimA-like FMN-containing flavoprotein (pyridoxamine 5'-phosphate oxidase superfamily)